MFDESHHYYLSVKYLVKPVEMMDKVMLEMDLENAFKFMRYTLNFDEAGYDREMYDKIIGDSLNVAELVNANWKGLEASTPATRRYVDEHLDDTWNQTVINGYGQARLKDYNFQVEARRLNEHFISRSDYTYTVNTQWLADMRIIDRYTTLISILPSIEDNMKKVQEDLCKVSDILNPLYGKIKEGTEAFQVLEALYTLKDKMYEFTVGGLNVFSCYKKRDNDAPYCFVKMLPSFQGGYGFERPSTDPWEVGSNYKGLYEQAARALSQHCSEFCKDRGTFLV